MSACVVVPARDEEDRIAGCLQALAAQDVTGAAPLDVVVVLDGCTDATAAVVAATARRLQDSLRVHTVAGPGRGSGPARGVGMAFARTLLGASGGLLLSTDADTRVAPDWLAAHHAAVLAGARAIGGRILLDPLEAAALDPSVVAAREAAAVGRLERVRRFAPDAEHHQFSGASLALTTDAYDLVGGLPDVTTLEDEALEARLRDAGIPISYLAAVRVTTSARLDGRARRGLADALAGWSAQAALTGG